MLSVSLNNVVIHRRLMLRKIKQIKKQKSEIWFRSNF